METLRELKKFDVLRMSRFSTKRKGNDKNFVVSKKKKKNLTRKKGIMVEEKETPEESCPKHVIDERKVEEAIERMYRSEQQDMFDDPDMNWSGSEMSYSLDKF